MGYDPAPVDTRRFTQLTSTGRKRTIQFAAVWALIAGIIQAASVNIGMLIAGRVIGGFAVGMMSRWFACGLITFKLTEIQT